METEATGRVLTEATIENLGDLWDAERDGLRAGVRRITVSNPWWTPVRRCCPCPAA